VVKNSRSTLIAYLVLCFTDFFARSGEFEGGADNRPDCRADLAEGRKCGADL